MVLSFTFDIVHLNATLLACQTGTVKAFFVPDREESTWCPTDRRPRRLFRSNVARDGCHLQARDALRAVVSISFHSMRSVTVHDTVKNLVDGAGGALASERSNT